MRDGHGKNQIRISNEFRFQLSRNKALRFATKICQNLSSMVMNWMPDDGPRARA